MKYFTEEWCKARISDEKIEEAIQAYEAYLEKIFWKLPFALKLLTRSINIRDAYLRDVILDKEKKTLSLNAICGDDQVRYFFLDILYQGVEEKELEEFLAKKRGEELEVLSDEIEQLETGNNKYSHKLLFSTMHHWDIHFEDVHISVQGAHFEDYFSQPCKIEIRKE